MSLVTSTRPPTFEVPAPRLLCLAKSAIQTASAGLLMPHSWSLLERKSLTLAYEEALRGDDGTRHGWQLALCFCGIRAGIGYVRGSDRAYKGRLERDPRFQFFTAALALALPQSWQGCCSTDDSTADSCTHHSTTFCRPHRQEHNLSCVTKR